MMYFLSKTVGSLFEPIAILWILLLIAFIRSWINKDKKQAFFTGFLAFFITVIGGTKISSYLLSSLERPYIIEDLNNIPQCDAMFTAPPFQRVRTYFHLVDRFRIQIIGLGFGNH